MTIDDTGYAVVPVGRLTIAIRAESERILEELSEMLDLSLTKTIEAALHFAHKRREEFLAEARRWIAEKNIPKRTQTKLKRRIPRGPEILDVG